MGNLRDKTKVLQTRKHDGEVYRQRATPLGKKFWTVESVIAEFDVPDPVLNHLKAVSENHKRRPRSPKNLSHKPKPQP